MPPNEYVDIDGVILNGDEVTSWWCDFDLSPMPIWGLRVTKGAAVLPVPHADEDLPLEVHGTAAEFSLIGAVYGSHDQAGAPVAGHGEQRMQLAENIAAITGLVGGSTKTLTYVVYDLTYTADVIVQGSQGTTSAPLDSHPTGPFAQILALKLSVAAGVLTPSGS